MDPTANSTGWLLVERDDRLTDLTAVTSHPWNAAVALAVLEFLQLELSTRLDTDSIQVIRFEYVGAYPALGIRDTAKDVTVAQVQIEIDRILEEVPISRLLSFWRSHPVDWAVKSDSLVRRG